jgi:predicted ATPase/DNA-binding CsgD family transcriptional regulator/DNA-binding XRE family transcriptional regulator
LDTSRYDVVAMGTRAAGSAFGEHLRRYREAAGLTQEELAERAGLTGKAISALERGERRRPYPQTIRALAAALGLGDAERGTLLATVPSRAGLLRGSPDEPEDAGSLNAMLPPEPTPLFGRNDELAIVRDQVLAPDVRLLTLVGPGGVGKTRLATAAARTLAVESGAFHSVWFVDLSTTRDSSLVLATVARAVRAADSSADPLAALTAFLGERPALLVLDNFEQVLGAAADVGRLLAANPELTLLGTSRQPLRLRWERTLPVHPLALPDPRHLPLLDDLAKVPAVALFLQRAQASRPEFALTGQNASAVAELCVRLDGLPLAIELVAARAAQLGVASTLERLAHRLPIPASFMHDAPARQQSLRATLQWSLDLLDEAELALFRRLGVFVGGWSIPAAHAVSGEGAADVLDGLTSLADKCLVVVHDARDEGDEPRFRMLETAREVALELLDASNEGDEVRARHARYFAALAEEAAARLQGATQASAVETLEREEDNISQTLRWAMTTRHTDASESALRIAGALGWYWFLHGYPPEARDWFEALLRPETGESSNGDGADERTRTLRAKALNAAGFRATDHGEYPAAATFHKEALATWRELDHMPGLVASLHGVGDTALWVGNVDSARASYEEGLDLARRQGTREDVALFAFHLAQLSWLQGELETGEEFGQEALSVGREAGSTTWPPYALFVLASLAHERGDTREAGRLYREAIALGWEHHDRLCVRMALPGLAALATLEGDPARALRLAGAASALEENAGIWAFPPIRERHERWLASAERALAPEARAAAWAAGRALTIDEVIADALEEVAFVGSGTGKATGPGRLSPREQEVLALVAEGHSNREIAKLLFVTEHTAKYHVSSLFNKLGVTTRAEAVARAVALALLTPGDQ